MYNLHAHVHKVHYMCTLYLPTVHVQCHFPTEMSEHFVVLTACIYMYMYMGSCDLHIYTMSLPMFVCVCVGVCVCVHMHVPTVI